MYRSPNAGLSLPEVMVAVVILTVASGILFQTFNGAVRMQSRRAVQEEALIFASDYLEFQKLQMLTKEQNLAVFDTIRPFRSDTLRLRTTILAETDRSMQEQFAVFVDSTALVTCTLSVPLETRKKW